MPGAFRDLCDELNRTLTPALVAAGYAAPAERFDRRQLRYEFTRASPAGRQTVAILFRRTRTPEFSVQLFVEPSSGHGEFMASGGTLPVGTVTPKRAPWPLGVRTFSTRQPSLSRLLRRPAPTAAMTVQRALALLPEIEAWWRDQRDTRHILSATVTYRQADQAGAAR
jgi:hypothetical protein